MGGQMMDAAPPRAQSGTAMPATAKTARWENEEPRFRARWEQRHGSQGESWEDYEPCHRYAWEMHNDPRYRDRPWQDVEPDLRRDWEQRYPDTAWDRAMDSIRGHVGQAPYLRRLRVSRLYSVTTRALEVASSSHLQGIIIYPAGADPEG